MVARVGWVLVAALSLSACSLVTVEQKPFSPLQISAAPPPPPPEEPKRVEVTGDAIKIADKIQFEYNSADIKEESFGLIDEIAAVLKDNARITKVDVEGHTDSSGSARYNRKLSLKRAKSVVAYLVDKGIDAGRLEAKGYGAEKPIAPNDTDEGKDANRRVEFNIVEQGDGGEEQ